MNKQATPSQASEEPVWFITGCSKGFGLELARQTIGCGYRTVVTARDPAKLQGFFVGDQVLVLKLANFAQPAKNVKLA